MKLPLSLVVLALIRFTDSALSTGLTLTVYENTARMPSPNTRKSLLHTPSFAYNTTEPFSADIEGTISFNTSGVYEFNCTFGRTTTAFVWIDGHMVRVPYCYTLCMSVQFRCATTATRTTQLLAPWIILYQSKAKTVAHRSKRSRSAHM